MPWPDDEDGDDVEFRQPLPPEDRIWRHPAELAAMRATPPPPRARSRAGLAALSALGGALLTTSLWFLFGGLDTQTVRVREQVALRPVVPIEPRLVNDEDWAAEATANASGAVVGVEVTRGGVKASGAGVLLLDDGHLVTPAHLVAGAEAIRVTPAGGRPLTATLVGADGPSDVAVLKIDGGSWPTAVLSADAAPEPGARVAIVSAVNGVTRLWETTIAGLDAQPSTTSPLLVRLREAVARSADGAALVDERGAVVGLAVVRGDAGPREGFALPISHVRQVAWQLIVTGRAAHPVIGLHGTAVTGDRGSQRGGVLVHGVSPGGPAAAAGLRQGDLVIAVDGRAVSSMTEVVLRLHERGIGSQITVDYLRQERPSQATVTIGQTPNGS